MADGYGIEQLEAYIDRLRDSGSTFELQNLSKEVQQVLSYLIKLWDQTVKGDVPTQKELKELQKGFYSYIQSSQATTKETRNYVSMMFNQLLARIDKLDKNRALHSMNANLSNMVNSGILDFGKKGAQNNVLAQLLKGGFLSPVTNSITGFQDKLMSFLNIEKSQEKTKKRQFVDDLVEGLSRSKFVGGAISDLVRLGTFLIAGWLKNKGTWGKVLAVALVAAGPLIGAAIAGAIVKGITTLFTRALGLIGKGVWNVAKWVGGKLFSWMGKILAAIWASKALGGLRGALSGLGIGGRATGIAKAGALLAPGTSGFLADSMLVGGAGVAQNTAKAGVLNGIWGVVKKIGPWLLRAGKLFNVVGWIWLGIEAILGIIKWWKSRKESGADKKGFGFWKKEDTSSEEPKPKLGEDFIEGTSPNIQTGTQSGGKHGVTSSYGWRKDPWTGERKFHTGVDLAYGMNEKVLAYEGGTVSSAGWISGYGNTVTVVDSTGKEHLYAHLNGFNGIQKGQKINKGDVIGLAGATGRATGPHLHYEVRTSAGLPKGNESNTINPMGYVNGLQAPSSSAVNSSTNGAKHPDKFTQNVVDFWDSKGKDKGKKLHWWGGYEKSRDYAELAERYKKEYAQNYLKEHPENTYVGSSLDLKDSPAARDYANKKIAEFVAEAKKSSIAVGDSAANGAGSSASDDDDIKDIGLSASAQAKAQWDRINKEFKEESDEVIRASKQPMLDFTGTENCSKVLQNIVNIQQQAYQQR